MTKITDCERAEILRALDSLDGAVDPCTQDRASLTLQIVGDWLANSFEHGIAYPDERCARLLGRVSATQAFAVGREREAHGERLGERKYTDELWVAWTYGLQGWELVKHPLPLLWTWEESECLIPCDSEDLD